MDTLSHALSGALAARAAAGPMSGLPQTHSMLAGLVAAGFPDVDYGLFWVAPLEFLNWHRGLTHSLVLLPLWALLLATLLSQLNHSRHLWQGYLGICALGLAIHIGGDVITIYGTKLLAPLSAEPFALNLIFDLDPYMAVIIGAGFLGSLVWRARLALLLTIIVVAGYLTLQGIMQVRTLALGERFAAARGMQNIQVYALPQPFLPLTWKVVVVHGEHYWQAYINHLPWPMLTVSEDDWLVWRMVAAYRPTDRLQWQTYSRFGNGEATQTLTRMVWQQDRFAPFRQFAQLPALYRVDHYETGEVCVWFTELRHNFPVLPPSFRYGLCQRSKDAPWRLYRLRYFRERDRQPLG